MITRAIFKANDIRGVTEGPDPQWDVAGAYAIGAALVDTLDLNAAEGALVVGRDMRISGPEMSAAFIDGVLSRGADVVDIGLASTDQLWFASGRLGLPGAMFTASHNPAEYNGIKFCWPRPVRRPGPDGRIADRRCRGGCRRPRRAHAPGRPAHRDATTCTPRSPDRVDGWTWSWTRQGMAGTPCLPCLGRSTWNWSGGTPTPTARSNTAQPARARELLDAQGPGDRTRRRLGLVFDGDGDRASSSTARHGRTRRRGPR